MIQYQNQVKIKSKSNYQGIEPIPSMNFPHSFTPFSSDIWRANDFAIQKREIKPIASNIFH